MRTCRTSWVRVEPTIPTGRSEPRDEEETVHDNPRASEEEQELAQTERMREEEEQRGASRPAEESDEPDDDENE